MCYSQDAEVLDIVKMATAQQLAVNSALTKHERIAQLQAAQELIQRQIADLLQMESLSLISSTLTLSFSLSPVL